MEKRCFGLLLALVLVMGCRAKSASSDVPDGHHLCRYCCSTANVACSCAVLDAVSCPEPNDTAKLPACAECRQCSQLISADQSCAPLLTP